VAVYGGYVTAGHCGRSGVVRGWDGSNQGEFRGWSFPGNDYAWVATGYGWWTVPDTPLAQPDLHDPGSGVVDDDRAVHRQREGPEELSGACVGKVQAPDSWEGLGDAADGGPATG
jgi:hypothetical protein